MFGGKDVLLSGDFLQMKDFSTAVFNSLHVTVTKDGVNFRRLMSDFDVFTLKIK